MGVPLQKYLLDSGHEVHITSRSYHESSDIQYHCGNAHDRSFLADVLNMKFDVIVDFMVYKTEEFAERVPLLLSGAGQYIFTSSCRVYAPCEGMITETHPRLLDVCDDAEYLKTDEYGLAKARQEDCLFDNPGKNWTIVRPGLTYNSARLQYAIGEKEEWLYRFLKNEAVVFPVNMRDVLTTMSYGDDVSRAIALLAGNEKAIGQTVHIAGADPLTWGEVNDVYDSVLKEMLHRKIVFKYVDDWTDVGRKLNKYWQLKYARSISRRFDNSKLFGIVGDIPFCGPQEGLRKCLLEFLKGNPAFNKISWKKEAYYNRICGERGCLESFQGTDKAKYLIARYTPFFEIRYGK